MIITWALQTQPAPEQPWHTNSHNTDADGYLADVGYDPDNPAELAQQLAERIGIHTDTAALVEKRGLHRIAVWMGEDHAGEPDGTYGSLDVLGIAV
jgi:hypothetical protein